MLDNASLEDPVATYAKGEGSDGFYPLRSVDSLLNSEMLLDNYRISLPFRITLVRTQEQLEKAVATRALVFGRKSLQLSTVLAKPEDADYLSNSIVLVAECKTTGDCLGTMRIVSNLTGTLDIEEHPDFPDEFKGRRIARAERLGVKPGKNATLVKLILFKALHRYCLALQIDWIIAQAASPRDRDYRLLGFKQIMPNANLRSLLSPEKVQACLALNVHAAERQFHESGHHLYHLMIATWHPDIDIFASVQSQWARPRTRPVPEDESGIGRPS